MKATWNFLTLWLFPKNVFPWGRSTRQISFYTSGKIESCLFQNCHVSHIIFWPQSGSPVAGRPVARRCRGCDTPCQVCQKVHFLQQSGQKIGFCRRVKWWRLKSPPLGSCTSLKSILTMGQFAGVFCDLPVILPGSDHVFLPCGVFIVCFQYLYFLKIPKVQLILTIPYGFMQLSV